VHPSPRAHIRSRPYYENAALLDHWFRYLNRPLITYELSKVSADAINYIPLVGLLGGSASGTKKELVVLCDENSIVKRFSMSESPVQTKTGIFNR